MTLASGTTLGPYEIVAPLGAGGMGEVYRARDTRLDREVAIKVLPDALARDAERVARFQREAKVLASVNHPNIAAIYGFEEAKKKSFLVMELVEGETLSEIIKAGRIPVEDALSFGKQIAEALEAAHERGVIHRDLKPANVMIRKDGSVKVLDFGLAKAMAEESSTSVPADSPTITANYTRPGVVLGTAGYMSPEQARGRPLDKRTDIWSFGCVLYECLGGSRPFSGETTTDMIARILERDPDWNALPPNTPANVRALLRRCLQKDRKERLRDIGDAVIELSDAMSTRAWLGPVGESHVKDRRPASTSRRVVSAVVFLVGGLSVGFVLSKVSTPSEQAPVVRASILPPKDARFISIGEIEGYATLSPDGVRLAFVARDDEGKERLWVRSLSGLFAHALPGTEAARNPFWSPDGASLGFFAEGQLKRIDVDAGSPIRLCDAPMGRGGTWGSGDVILFAPDFRTPIYRISSAGGTPTPVTTPDPARHTTHRWPWMLPDGKHFLYMAANHDLSRAEHNAVYFASLDGSTNELVMRTGARAAFASGYLFSLRGSTLMAQPFDPDSGELSGHPLAIADKVQTDSGSWSAAYSASDTGILAYHGGAAPGTRLTWVDRGTGGRISIGEERAQFATPRLSPDGKRLAVTLGNPGDIWVYELERNVGTRLTRDPAYEWTPIWSPDGRSIAYSANFSADSLNRIYVTPASGAAGRVEVVSSDELLSIMDWSPDGQYLVYWQGPGFPTGAYWIKHLDSAKDPVQFLETPFATGTARISPNGRWIAYSSNESGKDEIYVAAFVPPTVDAAVQPASPAPPGVAGGKQRISTAGGREPVWRRDGSELFYVAPGSTLMAVAVNGDNDRFEVGAVTTISAINVTGFGIFGTNFDVAPDGQRFVFPSATGEGSQPITLVLNWPAELRRK